MQDGIFLQQAVPILNLSVNMKDGAHIVPSRPWPSDSTYVYFILHATVKRSQRRRVLPGAGGMATDYQLLHV